MLKNCPFCGGEATIERDIGEHTGMKRYTPACQKCGANIRALHSIEAAVAFWNDRAEVDALTAEAEDAIPNKKPSCFYNDNPNATTCLGMAPRDGDEPVEKCKRCTWCESYEQDDATN